jgi:DNA-binding GntR family transcriptional regulator
VKRIKLEDILPPQARESQASHAYRLLELMIVALELAPGAAVTEADLCLKLGMGRTPVREALQRLEKEWLITIVPRRGMFVTDIDFEMQSSLLAARRCIEGEVVILAATRASEAQKAQFRALSGQFAELATSGDDLTMACVDSAFNQLTFEVAANPFLSTALERMHGLSRRYWYVLSRKADIFAPTAQLHSVLANAIARADCGAALRALDELLDLTERTTKATFLKVAQE